MTGLPDSARELLESAALAHVVTINPDGSPQVSCVWVGLDGEEIVAAHLNREQRKLANLRRDPRVCLTIEGTGTNALGMRDYLTVRGRAQLQEGGAPELLQLLARTYVGADVKFPPMDDPPAGVVSRITVERLGGHGPWAAKSPT